ncbi:hypothetical protein Q9966_014573 [Columba livia]|nr:hypothetical protein Q9966_014573 [Columba livia]
MKHDKAVVTVFPGFRSSFHPEGSQSMSPFHLMKRRMRERVTWVPVCLTSACSLPRLRLAEANCIRPGCRGSDVWLCVLAIMGVTWRLSAQSGVIRPQSKLNKETQTLLTIHFGYSLQSGDSPLHLCSL